MDKKKLTETDIITKFIMRGQIGMRKTVKSDDVLYHKPSMPLAVIEAKANKHEVGKGIQQGLDYARLLEVPFIFASNGDGYIFYDKTNKVHLADAVVENALSTHVVS